MINFKNKKIIITGASGGIGRSLVEKFVNLNGNVLATGTKIEKLENLKAHEMYNKVKVFVNGCWIGISYDPEKLMSNLKEKKYSGIINIYTSIVFDTETMCINVCNDGGTDTAVTCASAGDGTWGSYCGDTLYCQNLATGETSSDGLGALSSCPTLDVCLRCSDLGYSHPDACGQNSGIGATHSGTPVEDYCCDCDGQLWDCCGVCGS